MKRNTNVGSFRKAGLLFERSVLCVGVVVVVMASGTELKVGRRLELGLGL